MESKKRNPFLVIIGVLVLIIVVFVVFVLLIKVKTTNDASTVAETEEIAGSNDNSAEAVTENIVDYEALGIKEYKYPPEFSMGDNLEAAITELANSFDSFDEDSVYSEWWKESFIADFIQNSRLSFDYLEMAAEKNNGRIGIDELNYIQHSLTNIELDFSSYVNGPVDRYDAASGYSSGLITGWDYEYTDDGVIVTADFEVETSGSSTVWEQELTVRLVKNPYSCFDGYSIVSLSSKDTPLSVESGEYVFYGIDMTENENSGVHPFEFVYAEDDLRYGHFVYVDMTGLPDMADFARKNADGTILKVTFFLEEGEIDKLVTVVPIDITLDDR